MQDFVTQETLAEIAEAENEEQSERVLTDHEIEEG